MAKTPEKDTGWVDHTIPFHKFEKAGDTIIGELIEKGEITFHKGTDREATVGKYTVKQENGEKIAFLGGVQVDPMLADIDEGETIKFVYEGRDKTTSGTEVKMFKVYTKSG